MRVGLELVPAAFHSDYFKSRHRGFPVVVGIDQQHLNKPTALENSIRLDAKLSFVG